jgi:hypothetical protein
MEEVFSSGRAVGFYQTVRHYPHKIELLMALFERIRSYETGFVKRKGFGTKVMAFNWVCSLFWPSSPHKLRPEILVL